jgi:hypothetical protein
MWRCAPIVGGLALGMVSACALLTDLSGFDEGQKPTSEGDATSAVDGAPESGNEGEASVNGGRDATTADTGNDSGVACTKRTLGQHCNADGDCCSNNCFSNACQGNDEGSGCSTDSDCNSKNCLFNVCQGNDEGSGCSSDSNCTSKNCTFNVCRGNSQGSPCTHDEQCTSNDCAFGACQ